ncbi:hypothetical protein F8M41_019229 [Gigaspora margarita]|uniref:CCHC-type domain-containing protein n=1 Tax=Gigaspora margarita TaxID=4874 RepID=A0A8H4AKA7_GIGMA|nr:hypothetical protein F8M41_019229 [Gigaspora margarita]
MELSNTDYQNREEKENNNSISLQLIQLSVESGSTSSQRTQPICKICQGNHEFRFCPNTVCGLCQKKGHIKRDCLLFKCSKCRRQGHNRQECGKQCFRCHEYHVNTTICPPVEERKKSPKEIKEIQQKEKECNYCHQKGHIEYYCETKEIYQKNLNIECGCSEGMNYHKRRNYGNNKTKFHCDKCHMPNEESKIDIEDKYSLEYENDDYPEEGSEFENYYHSGYAEETDLQEALERSLQTFTEWTKEMSISKTDKTFPNGYNQCQACYMCFDKENTDDLKKIYSIDEEKELLL